MGWGEMGIAARDEGGNIKIKKENGYADKLIGIKKKERKSSRELNNAKSQVFHHAKLVENWRQKRWD